MDTPLIQSFLIALAVGISSGAVGAFIILKRMALVGDALSHVALPGIALALIYSVDPFWGLLASLLAAAVLVWLLESRAKLPSEALVGILFTASLAIGILAIPNTELVESLFGEFPAFGPLTLALFLITAAALTFITFCLTKRFLFTVISPELAQVHGTGKKYELILFVIFAATVALGIKLVGALLMGALTIIPASIAKNTTKSMKLYMPLAAVFGGAISVAGIFISNRFEFLPGPTIVLLGVALFFLSLFFVKR
ncbi:MAG: metal ABC transporter permease [Parcubacteria group bacterium]|nr:metal ABC transporter permease [Parcubacteria group bacterium]